MASPTGCCVTYNPLDNPATLSTLKRNSSDSMRVGNESEWIIGSVLFPTPLQARFTIPPESVKLRWSYPEIAPEANQRHVEKTECADEGSPPFCHKSDKGYKRYICSTRNQLWWTKAQVVHSPGHPNTQYLEGLGYIRVSPSNTRSF